VALLVWRLVSARAFGADWPLLLALAVAAGYASVTRTEAILFFAGLTLATWCVTSLRSVRPEGTAAMIGVALALLSWGARNWSVLGRFHATTTRDGIALWESIGPHAWEAVSYGQVEKLSYGEDTMGEHWEQTRAMSELEANDYFRRRALDFAVEEPLAVAAVALRKIGITLAGVRPNEPMTGARNLVAWLSNAALLLLAAVGLPRLWRLGRGTSKVGGLWLLALVAGATLPGLLLGPIGMRYRIAMDGVLWLAAAATLALPRPASEEGA
jgi:hypothetical protein